MVFDSDFLDSLTVKAKENERLRQHYDLRNSEDDNCQMMLNAVEPGTVLKIHKHPHSSTLTIVLRGSVLIHIYNDEGVVLKSVKLTTDSCPGFTVLENEWHNLESLETGTVIYEQKGCKYDPKTDSVFFEDK